jgi:hypothetical protein
VLYWKVIEPGGRLASDIDAERALARVDADSVDDQ